MDVPSAATCHVCTPQLLRVTQAFGYVMDVPHFSLVDKWSNQLIGAFAMWMAQAAPVVVNLYVARYLMTVNAVVVRAWHATARVCEDERGWRRLV